MEELVAWILVDLLGPVVQAISHGVRAVWRVYVPVLNLPILAAVAVDSVGGVLGGLSLMDSAGLGASLLGWGLVVGAPLFFVASLLSWGFKVLDEIEENERRQLASDL